MITLNQKDERKRHQIIHGSLWKTILILSLPLAIYETFNYLYSFIDLWLVTGMDTSFVTSVIFVDEIRLAVAAFGGSIAAAGSVVVARFYGSNELENAKKSAFQALILAIIVSFTIVILMVTFGEIILRFFGATETIIDQSLSYYNVQMITTALVAFNSVFIGLEKAKGNTKVILIVNIAVMLVKLGVSVVWVRYFNGGLLELSLSSLLAQLILSFVGIYVLMFYKHNSLRLSIRDIKIDKVLIKEIFLLAIPVFLGKFLFNMGKVIINGIALLYHEFVVAALGICGKIFGFFANVANVFHEAEMSIVSQNLGNKKLDRAIKTFYISLIYAASVSIIGLIVSHFIKEYMIQILGDFSTEEIFVILEIYKYEQYSLVFSALISVISGFFIGFKRTRIVFWINITRVVILRLPVLYIMYQITGGENFRDVGFVMFFSNSLTTLLCFFLVFKFIQEIKTFGYDQIPYKI